MVVLCIKRLIIDNIIRMNTDNFHLLFPVITHGIFQSALISVNEMFDELCGSFGTDAVRGLSSIRPVAALSPH